MNRLGVLIIHGTFGSYREFAQLEALLNADGFITRTVDLPGHGDNPKKALNQVSGEEMLVHCRDEYYTLAEECDGVVVLGHSLGGVCALMTAASARQKLAGVIALSTPYEYAYSVNYTHGLLKVPIKNLMKAARFLPEGRTGFKPPRFKPWWFLRFYKEAHIVLRQLQDCLPSLDVPVWLAHSPHDLIVPYAEMQKIARSINKPHLVRTVTLDACGHQIFPKSNEQQRVSTLIREFINEVYAGEKQGSSVIS